MRPYLVVQTEVLFMLRRLIIPLTLIVPFFSLASSASDWPQFRGPDSTGISSDKKLPTEWGADKNIAWSRSIPGTGWSSPIVWGDKVFVTSAETDNQKKPSAGGFGGGGGKGKGDGGGGGKGKGDGGGGGGFGKAGPPNAVYRWQILCLNRDTGEVLWKKLAVEKKPSIPTQSANTYASETPVTDGERVYAYFGMTGLFCYDFKGELVWKKDLGSYPMMLGFGTGSSPVLDGDRLFVQCDNEEKSFLAAFNKKTGDELWRVSRNDKSSWSTPIVWKNKQRTELVCCGKSAMRSYDPATGKVYWEIKMANGGGGGGKGGPGGGGGSPLSASPAASDELLFIGSGGSAGSSGPLFAVKAGANGDITLKDGATSNEGIAWSAAHSGPAMASPLVYEGRLYILEQRGGGLSCYDAKTGKTIYSKERISGARGFTSSPWACDGRIFCLDDSGQTYIVQAGDEFKVLGKNSLNEMFWASPAISDGTLFLRGVDHLYCIKTK
jgi:outer membrane protein assembly factor BamB